jgi:tripartite-type tricarboxylate transporter receptor subunit TctC
MSAQAQSTAEAFPNKPIRFVVPFPPGGGNDILARALAPKMSEILGQQVVVDNRAGAGGNIGADFVAKSTPDGYTIAMVSGSYGANAALFKIPYDPINDITPISLIGETGFLVSLHPTVQAKTVKELITLAKSKSGGLIYGSTGTGGITHLATELFDIMAGTKMTHVPYKGTGPAMADLLGGQIQLVFGAMPAMVPQHKAGRLRGIAVTTGKRIPTIPDIPTVGETLTGYEAVLWYAAWGPKNLPKEIVSLWNREIARAITTPELKLRMEGEGLEPAGGPPEQLRDMLNREIPKWQRVVKEANVKSIQ